MNVALPAIRTDLHGGLTTQEWIVDAYLLTLGSLLLVGGSLGDVFGRRRVFGIGVAGFGIASVLCGVAPGSGALIAARALQGVSGALLVPSTLALIIDTFPEAKRAGAIGTWTAWTGIATVIGPLVGGSLVQVASWRWIFLVNVPFILATLWLLRHAPTAEQPDDEVLGAVESGRVGVASGVNNAVARVANLVAIAAVGAVVAGHYATALDSRLPPSPPRRHAEARPLVIDASGFPPAQRQRARAALIRASVDSFRLAIEIAAGLAFLSGAISLGGIANARREVMAAGCPGGALCGASTDVARVRTSPVTWSFSRSPD